MADSPQILRAALEKNMGCAKSKLQRSHSSTAAHVGSLFDISRIGGWKCFGDYWMHNRYLVSTLCMSTFAQLLTVSKTPEVEREAASHPSLDGPGVKTVHTRTVKNPHLFRQSSNFSVRQLESFIDTTSYVKMPVVLVCDFVTLLMCSRHEMRNPLSAIIQSADVGNVFFLPREVLLTLLEYYLLSARC